MKRFRWTRVLIFEGPKDWIEKVKDRSWLPEGDYTKLLGGRSARCKESKIEEVKKNDKNAVGKVRSEQETSKGSIPGDD